MTDKWIARAKYQRTWFNKAMSDAKDARGGRCEHCSRFDRGLEFAHIDPCLSGMGRGGVQRLKEIRAHPERFKLLCHDCHKLYDRR